MRANLAGDEVEEEQDLLGQGQDQGSQGGDVGLQGVACDRHQLLGQEHARLALGVLLLEDAAVAGVAAAHVGAHHMQQLVPAGMAGSDEGPILWFVDTHKLGVLICVPRFRDRYGIWG